MGSWRGTLGTYDLNPGSRRFLWKSDGTCLGEERSREAKGAGRYSPVLRGVSVGPLTLCDGADPIPW